MGTAKKVVYNRNYIDAILEESGTEKVFIIASNTLDKTTTIVSDLVSKLESKDRYGGKFTGIQPHTTDVSCIEAANMIKASGCKCVVTIGGGSPTDAAKAIRMCLAYDIQTPAGFQAFREGDRLFNVLPSNFKSDLQVINVPTTLSAGEYSLIAGVKDTEKGVKCGWVSAYKQPIHFIDQSPKDVF